MGPHGWMEDAMKKKAQLDDETIIYVARHLDEPPSKTWVATVASNKQVIDMAVNRMVELKESGKLTYNAYRALADALAQSAIEQGVYEAGTRIGETIPKGIRWMGRKN